MFKYKGNPLKEDLMETTLQKSKINESPATSLNLCHNLIGCIDSEPMSDRYIGQCIVSVIIIK